MSAQRLGFAGLLALGVGLPTPAFAQQGVLTLTDRRLSSGATVTLTGAQFPPASRLAIALEGASGRTALGSVTAGPDGAFSQSLRVPRDIAPGAYRLVARAGEAVVGLDVAVLADTAAAPAVAGGKPQPDPMAGMSHAAPMPDDTSHTAAEPPAAATDSGAIVARPEGTILGYDWPRLHAALNDLPAALLVVAVLFEIAGLVIRQPSLRTASFWTLLAGLAGTIVAVIAGLMAEDLIDHDDIGHAVMQRHKTLALVALGVFALLALWRFVRRKTDRRGEQAAWCVVASAGLALLIITAQLGGSLMFDHAMGIPSRTLVDVLERRGAMPATQHGDSTAADSTAAPAARPHQDAPGAPPHSHTKRPPTDSAAHPHD